MLAVLVAQWARSSEREAARVDRALDRAEAEAEARAAAEVAGRGAGDVAGRGSTAPGSRDGAPTGRTAESR